MSTKSKRRSSRRAQASHGPASHERPTADGKVVGEIMGAVLSAFTFGALEGPASTRPKTATDAHPKHA